MKSGHYLAVSCLLFCMATGTVMSAEDHPFLLPDENSLARLRMGEVVLENDTADENGAAASILVFIQAPVERIWSIIVSCRYAQAFVAGLKICEVLEERSDYALTRQVVDEGRMTPRFDYTFAIERQPYRQMNFRLVEGNLKAMHGSWDFESFADGVLLRHVLVLQPVLPAPRWLVRRNMKQNLPDMMRCIRGLAAGGGSEQATRADRLKCPGEVRQG